jgi:hypothetical protein
MIVRILPMKQAFALTIIIKFCHLASIYSVDINYTIRTDENQKKESLFLLFKPVRFSDIISYYEEFNQKNHISSNIQTS